MENLKRNYIYQGKNMFRNKSFIFWSLIYPLIMAMFFYIAFNGLLNFELDTINIGINKNNPIQSILEEIDFFNVKVIEEQNIYEILDDPAIFGYIDKDSKLTVRKSGLEETIIKEVLDEIKQVGSLNISFDRSDFSVDYISTKNQRSDSILIIFYSFIGMVSAYSIFPGIETVSLIQANLSNVGQRLNITPLKKKNFLIAGVLVGLSLNIASNILLITFMKYVLKLDLLKNIKYSVLLILAGNIFGVALGTFIGASNRQNINAKTLIGIAATLFLSFLSGMISPDLKLIIESKMPFIKFINPITIITDNLYKINLLNITDGFVEGIIALSIISFILIALSYIALRRKSYDSI